MTDSRGEASLTMEKSSSRCLLRSPNSQPWAVRLIVIALMSSVFVPVALISTTHLTWHAVLAVLVLVTLAAWVSADLSRASVVLCGLLVAGGVALLFEGTVFSRLYRATVIISLVLLVRSHLTGHSLHRIIRFSAVDVAVGLLWAVVTLSLLSLRAGDERARSEWLRLTHSVVLYLVLTRTIESHGDFVRVFRAAGVAMVALAAVCLMQMARVLPFYGGATTFPRATGLGGETNMVAAMAAITTPWFVWLIQNDVRAGRAVGIAGLTSALIAVGLTYSRGGLVAMIASLLMTIALLARPGWSRWTTIVAVAVVVAVLMSAPVVDWTRWSERASPLLGVLRGLRAADVSDDAIRHRLVAPKIAFRVYTDRWVRGIGIGQSVHYMRQTLGVALLIHNTYLDVLLELGILGAAVYGVILGLDCWTLAAAARCLRRHESLFHLHLAVGISVAVLLVTFLTLSMAYHNVVFMIIGLSAGLGRISSSSCQRGTAFAQGRCNVRQ